MTFARKLIILLVLVAAIPVAVSGMFSILFSVEQMTGKIRELHRKGADLASRGLDDFFTDAVRTLSLATEFIPFDQFPEADLAGALKIPYRQFDFINIVALLDETGKQLAEPAFEADPSSERSLAAHESVAVGEVPEFGGHIPFRAALAEGKAFGPVYFNARTRTPRVALAIAFKVRQGAGRWVLAVEVSLRQVLDKLQQIVPHTGGAAFVVDGEGRVVCHTDEAPMAARASMIDLPIVSAGLKGRAPLDYRFVGLDRREMMGAFAPVPFLGWGLVVEQSEDEAFVAAREILRWGVIWVALSLALAVFGGVFFARGVSRPVAALVAGATEVGKGNFDHQIPVRSKDEIGKLSQTFNDMAGALKESFATIRAQNEEIQRWNLELQQRVEDRTRELKEAQEQIIQSQKLAAVAELGAGVAHEVNNPLTAIKGFTELMLSKTKPEDKFHSFLNATLAETERIRSIVADLQRFSTSTEGAERVPVDVNGALLDALRMVETQLQNQSILIRRQFSENLPAVSGNLAELQQVLLHIISNAKNAMPQGGELLLQTGEIDGGAVKVAIGDTGRGIPKENLLKIFEPFFTTKDDWSGKGLGLSVAYRIVEEHHGKINVASEVGKGSTFTVILPGMRQKLHLK